MMMSKKFLDTCSVLENYNDLTDCIICSKTIEELENIKTSYHKDEIIKFKVRKAVKAIERDNPKVVLIETSDYDKLYNQNLEITNDNLIIACAKRYSLQEDIIFFSEDYLCRLIAKNIFVLSVDKIQKKQIEQYKGYKVVYPTEQEMIDLYQDLTTNHFGCLMNEYVLIMNDEDEVVDKLKWIGDKYVNLSYRAINNDFMGKIKSRNPQQDLAFDMLQDKDTTIKCLTGKFGSGKSFLMISNAINLISTHKYDKMVFIRNNIEVKDTQPIGFLPGDGLDKLLPYAMPLADHCGGEVGLKMLIQQGKIEIVHMGFIRGRDLKNSIVYCTECENMTKEHIQLLIGRIGENSALWLDGDYKQVDGNVFKNNSGLSALVENLKGNKLFGYVNLEKTERSETAALADLLD